MRFSVSVPVLSVRITVVAPKVSTDDRLEMIALRAAIRHMPRARLSVATTGKPSGTAATANATPICTIAVISLPRRIPAPITRTASTSVNHGSRCPSTSRRFSSGETEESAVCTKWLIWPSSVSIPVVVTIPIPAP